MTPTKLTAIHLPILRVFTCILFVSILSCSTKGKNKFNLSPEGQKMADYLEEARQLTRQGKYEEALSHFIWYHNHVLEHEPGMEGVRLSFALSYWKELADKYQPALDSMKAYRDRALKVVFDSTHFIESFPEVVAFNGEFGEEEKTVVLFDTVNKRFPEKLRMVWLCAQDALLKAKRYDLLKPYLNPNSEYSRITNLYKIDSALSSQENTQYLDSSEGKNLYVLQILKLIGYCKEIKDSASTKTILNNALTVVNDSRLHQ
jgi:hypothetical protein